MVRILRHYIHRQTLYQIGIDLVVVGLFALLVWAYHSATPLAENPVVLLGAVLVATGISAVRVRSLAQPRVLVVGDGPQAALVAQQLRSADPHIRLVGPYATSAQGHAGTLAALVERERIQEIVIAVRERQGGEVLLRELLDCRRRGVRVLDVATHCEQMLGQIRRETVTARWLVLGEGFAHGPLHAFAKRLLDLVAASVLLLLALPVMLLAALLVALESGGPVLYRQERVGLQGRTFNMLKFRSMRADAEPDGHARWAHPADSRVTRVGRFMRRRRIDELPQLFNVLAGDMSLVGPRPERPCFVAMLTQKLPYYALRHSTKPGITGWAQVRFHYAASIDDTAEKLQYDLYYVKNQCLLLDLVILFDTVGVVLSGRGAQ